MSAVNNNERAGRTGATAAAGTTPPATPSPTRCRSSFSGSKTINRVVVYTLQDNYPNPVEPTDTMTFSLYGITAFTVQGRHWQPWLHLATVSGNNLVKRTVTFAPFTTGPHPHPRHRRPRLLLPHHRNRSLGKLRQFSYSVYDNQ